MMGFFWKRQLKNTNNLTKHILINKLIDPIDSLIVVGTTSMFVKLSITGFGLIVDAIAAGAR